MKISKEYNGKNRKVNSVFITSPISKGACAHCVFKKKKELLDCRCRIIDFKDKPQKYFSKM